MSRLFLQHSIRFSPLTDGRSSKLAWLPLGVVAVIAWVSNAGPMSKSLGQEQSLVQTEAVNPTVADGETKSTEPKDGNAKDESTYLRISKTDEGKPKALETAIRRYTAKPGDRYPMLKSIWSV